MRSKQNVKQYKKDNVFDEGGGELPGWPQGAGDGIKMLFYPFVIGKFNFFFFLSLYVCVQHTPQEGCKTGGFLGFVLLSCFPNPIKLLLKGPSSSRAALHSAGVLRAASECGQSIANMFNIPRTGLSGEY